MKRILAIAVIALLSLPLASAADFPPWSLWEVSNPGYVNIHDGLAEVDFSNDSLQMSAEIGNLEKGDRVSIPFEYSISQATVIAGFRVLVDGEEIESAELISSGRGYINITVAENAKEMKITLMFYAVQGSMHVVLHPGKVISPPKGWESGLLISGVGITVVFLVLGVLSAIMYGFEFLEKREEAGEKDEEVKEERDMAGGEGIPPEDIVAIAAAIQEYMKGRRFRIISVKPSPWKYYGRMMNMRRWK